MGIIPTFFMIINTTSAYISGSKPISSNDKAAINRLKRLDNSNMLKNISKIHAIVKKYIKSPNDLVLFDVPQYCAPALVVHLNSNGIHCGFRKKVNGRNVIVKY